MRAPSLAPALLIAALLATATPVLAVQPNEVLPDAAMEARARNLSQGLRCLVCRNENIDDSNAELAHDLRVLLRERLVAGDTDVEAVAFIVDRYGEYVLLNPTTKGSNLLLWLAGPAMLLAGLGIAGAYMRRRRDVPEAATTALSGAEQARLKEIMRE